MDSCLKEWNPYQKLTTLETKFAQKVCRKLFANFWEVGAGFYQDGASFTHKMNPPRAMAWRKTGKGFDFAFTRNGSHEGIGGNVAHFMAAIIYGKGVIAAKQCHGRTNAEKFSLFLLEQFASILGDTSQNSRKARFVWEEVGARKLTIPARRPDLNPTKKIFHVVKRMLHEDALDRRITQEDFAAFYARVKTTLEFIPIDVVDRTILSMGKRINEIVTQKEQKIKYQFYFYV